MGDRLGPYTLLKRIGRGGMAEVLMARAPDGTDVVIKRMLPHLAEEPAYVRMFLREARIAARLNHGNVVRLLDVDKEGDDLYLVFELVDGVTLYELARRSWQAEKSLPIEMCLRAVADAAIGLHHAHELKDENGATSLVHRDVSPDNLMIDTAGVTRVLDFGIAKLTDDAHGNVSKTGELRGKLAFMSPEQAQGLPLDRRSDLFSLGTTLFWLLTAQKPFFGRTDILTLRALLEHDAPAPSSVNPKIPRAVDPIMRRLLAKDSADRFATAGALHEALVALLPPGDDVRALSGRFVADVLALKAESHERDEGTQIMLPPSTIPSAAVLLLDVDAKVPAPAPPSPLVKKSRAPLVAASVAMALAVALVAAWVATRAPPATVTLATNVPLTAPAVPLTAPAVPLATTTVPLATTTVPVVPVDAGEAIDEGDDGADDVPLASIDAAHPRPAQKRVTVVGSVQWRTSKRPLSPKGGVVEVPAGTKALLAVDGYGGVREVPIDNGRADFSALPKRSVSIWLPPTGGEVFLGNKSLGQAPLKPLELTVGTYKLRAKSGDKSIEQKLVVAGEPVRITLIPK